MMPIKTTGAEWKAFYNDESVWVEDGCRWIIDTNSKFELNVSGEFIHSTEGLDKIKKTDVVRINGGWCESEDGQYCDSLVSMFNRWRKKKSTCRVVVEVHKSVYNDLIQIIKANGGRVV